MGATSTIRLNTIYAFRQLDAAVTITCTPDSTWVDNATFTCSEKPATLVDIIENRNGLLNNRSCTINGTNSVDLTFDTGAYAPFAMEINTSVPFQSVPASKSLSMTCSMSTSSSAIDSKFTTNSRTTTVTLTYSGTTVVEVANVV